MLAYALLQEAVFLIPGSLVLLGPAGIILYGFAAEKGLHWTLYFVGGGLSYFAAYFYFTFTLAYAVDSYYSNTSEMLIAMNLGKQYAFPTTHSFPTPVKFSIFTHPCLLPNAPNNKQNLSEKRYFLTLGLLQSYLFWFWPKTTNMGYGEWLCSCHVRYLRGCAVSKQPSLACLHDLGEGNP